MTYDNRINRRTLIGGLTGIGLSAACQPSDQNFDAEIIVLGAGLSGLYAAHLLAGEGKDVLVLEGSNRIGGRMETIYHNGHYTEGGGEQIGASYARILDRSSQLGVKLSQSKGELRGTAYQYDGQIFGPDDWKVFGDHPLPVPFNGGSATRALFGLAGRQNPLQSAGDWRNSDHAAFDISVAEFLKRNGMDDRARAFIDHTLNANDLNSYSIMNVFRSLILYQQSSSMGPSLYVEGGVQKLMDAMGSAQNVQTNQIVSSIKTTHNSIEIESKSGRTYRAKTCICALPFGAFKNIRIDAPISELQKAAIRQLPYTQILQVHFEFENSYWETDGLPADMWTDLPMERLFANRTLGGEFTGLARMWINGTGALNLTTKSDAEIKDLAQTWMTQVRPSAGKINPYRIQRWTNTNPLAGGAYMHWAPGQIGKWAQDMGKSAGPLHFCGEHLSHFYTGMEGAMESAENIAFHLLDV